MMYHSITLKTSRPETIMYRGMPLDPTARRLHGGEIISGDPIHATRHSRAVVVRSPSLSRSRFQELLSTRLSRT